MHNTGIKRSPNYDKPVTKKQVVIADQSFGGQKTNQLHIIENERSGRRFSFKGVNAEMEEELYIRRLLARRSFHLPRNNCCQDWIQFIKNNHVLFGICCHNPLHPLQLGHRIFILIGSIAFGLTATNGVYLWYAYSNEDMNKVIVQVTLGEMPLNSSLEEVKITYGMVTLWTFGSICHSIFDVTLWFLTACVCFIDGKCGKYSRFRSLGSYITVAVVAVMVALSSFVIAGRVIYESRLTAARNGVEVNDEQWAQVIEFESFSFLLGYGVESLLTYLVYYPLIVTIGFSGILHPCFRVFPCIRFLGGRQEELARQVRERNDMITQKRRKHEQEDQFEDDLDRVI